MKRVPALLALVLALVPSAARGQEPVESEFEFVRNLRAKGFAELAKEYLDQMQKRGDPQVKELLPLEQARTLVAMAREKDTDQRINLIAEARTALAAYVKHHTGKLEGAQATLELARLGSLQGQAMLTQALREEDNKAQHEKARPAEAVFQAAGKELAAAIKTLQDLASNYKNPDPKLEKAAKLKLAQDLGNARFDQGINLIDQARTYIDISLDANNTARAKIVDEARVVFEKLAKDDKDGPAGALANAWLMKVSMEQQTPQKTGDYYRKVISTEGAAFQPARRWARLFWMQNLPKDPTSKLKDEAKLKAIVEEAQDWLKNYPSQVRAPEGQGVLFELANALNDQARRSKDQKAKATTALYTEAQKYYAKLAEMDGDLSPRANQLSLALSFKLSENKDPRTFDDFYLKGMNEKNNFIQAREKLAEGGGKDRAKLEKERQEHLHGWVAGLNRATSLATSKTPVEKFDEARFNLTWAYVFSGDLARAAVAGEAIARTRPPTRFAAPGASAAIDAYARLYESDPDFGTRSRLEELAKFVLSAESQKAWANDPVSDFARYQLAMLYKRDENYKAAIGYLEKLSPNFPGYIYAQGQLVFLAEEGREKAKNAKNAEEEKAFIQMAKAALKRMPPLPEKEANPTTITMYFLAQMEMSKFLHGEAYEEMKNRHPDLAAKKYDEMAKALKALHERYQKVPVKLSQENHDRIEFTLAVLGKYADLGLADVEFQKGNYDEVFKTTQKVVDKVLADAKAIKGEEPLRLKDHEVTGKVLGLALRAHVQKGDVDRGKELLAVLQRLQGLEGDTGDRGGVIRRVLQEIETQVETLKSSSKKEDQERLKAMVGNFTSFLDAIAKEQENKKGFDPEATRMLAMAYASLDQHEKAASIFEKVPAPACLDKDTKKLSEDEVKQVSTYWYMQLQYAKALRQGKKQEDYDKAKKVLTNLLGHKNAKYQVLADMEVNLVLEDEKRYDQAFVRWSKFLKSPAFSSLSEPEVQKIFFTGAFNRIRTMYKYGMHQAKADKKPTYVRGAATDLVKLEFTPGQVGWNIIAPMARELLEAEAPLREEYDKIKAARQKEAK